MKGCLQGAVPGSLALMVGCYFGLHAVWCPPWSATLLLALGLARQSRWGFTVGFLGLGLLAGAVERDASLLPIADRPVLMVVEVTGSWRTTADGLRVRAQGRWLRQGLRIARWDQPLQLVLPPASNPPEPLLLRVRGFLRRPATPANGPRVRPGSWVLRVKSNYFLAPEKAGGRASGRLWNRAGRQIRDLIENRLADWESERPGLGPVLVRVLVLGQAAALPGPIARGVRAAGLAHVVALSGLHVGLLVAPVLILASGAPVKVRFALGMSTALLYVLVAGPRPSLLRATLMMGAVMVSWLLRRQPQPVNVLSWVAAAMVLVDPHLVNRLGFQLTVAATAGILLISSSLARRWGLLPELLRKSLSVSVASHLAILPWALSSFHLASPLSPLWNLLAVPWAAVALTVAFAWVICGITLPVLAVVPGEILTVLSSPLGAFEALPPTILGAVPVSFSWGIGLLIAVSLTVFLLTRGLPRWLSILAALSLILLSEPGQPGMPELILFDVGQGEAILLRDGDNSVLIDGGGWRQADIAQRILLPALTGLGIRHLDGVILSHPDTDHCGGLLALSSYMPIANFYASPGWFDDPCVMALLQRPGWQVQALWRGEELNLGRWQLRILHPEPASRSGRNNRSLVVLAKTGQTTILLTGDLEASGEQEILDWAGHDELRDVQILKVGHHGSATSTSIALLERTRPNLALISCGIANRYGHPSERVIQRLRARGIVVLRTDQLGAIRLSFPPSGHLRLGFPGMPRDRQ